MAILQKQMAMLKCPIRGEREAGALVELTAKGVEGWSSSDAECWPLPWLHSGAGQR